MGKKEDKKSNQDKHRYNTRSRKSVSNKKCQNKKRGSESDSDNDEGDFKKEEFQKLLYSIFPSKYLKDKIKNSNNNSDDESDYEEEDDEIENEVINKKSKKSKKGKKSKSKKGKKSKYEVQEDESYEDSEYEYETVDESEYEDDEDDEENPKIAKFDIIFTIKGEEEDGDYEEEDESDYEEEDESDYEEDEDYDEDEEEDEDEDEEEEEEEEEEDEEENNKKSKKSKNTKNKEEFTYEENKEILQNFKDMCKSFMNENKNNPILKDIEKQTKEIEKKIKKEEDKKNKKEKSKNCKKFTKLLTGRNVMNDYKFFKDKMDVDNQRKILNELEEVQKHTVINKPYKLKLLEAPIPQVYKACALKKINSLKMMHSSGGEYYKIKNWIDSFLQIPFENYKNLPVSVDDGVESCQTFMAEAQQKLDEAVYGMEDCKIQIMQMIGQWMTNPSSIGSSIALKGPMGTGKTTLIKEGVSKILGRDFAFIPLGGATDSSFLEGHSYTYEGSTYGKIVDILIQTKSSNPIIYFDELDKVSDTPKGEEIIGILTHLTDISQNTQFHDKYFSEIDFDLSKCLFIFSYNDESRVNPILRDRMYVIETKGYKSPEKMIISNNYIIPYIEKMLKLQRNNVTFDEGVLEYIIQKFTKEEKGVRNLKRCIEIIFSKINLYRLMKPDSKLFSQDIISNIEFPFNVTKEHVDKLIKYDDNKSQHHLSMYL